MEARICVMVKAKQYNQMYDNNYNNNNDDNRRREPADFVKRIINFKPAS